MTPFCLGAPVEAHKALHDAFGVFSRAFVTVASLEVTEHSSAHLWEYKVIWLLR